MVFVQAGELPHRRDEQFQHAVVVVEATQRHILILDPDDNPEPIAVEIGDFMLAWGELDYLYATIIEEQ